MELPAGWASRRLVRMLFGLLSTLALLSCAAPANPPAAGVAATATAPRAAATALPAPTSAPRATATAPAQPALPTNAPPPAASPAPTPPTPSEHEANFAWPIDAPTFPTREIAADNLAELKLFRSLGIGSIREAAAAPAGSIIALATSAGLALLKLPTFELVSFEPGSLGHAALSPDGQRLLADTALLRTADGSKIAAIAGDLPRFSRDGQLLATRSAQSPARTDIWRSADGRQIQSIPGDSAAFSPNGQLVASRTDADVRVLRLADGQPGRILPVLGSTVKDLAFSPDGQQLLVALANELQTWRIADGQLVAKLPINHAAEPGFAGQGGELGEKVVLSPAGDLFMSVVVGSGEGYSYTIELHSTADGQPVAKPAWGAISAENFRFSDDGTAASGWSNERTISFSSRDQVTLLDLRTQAQATLTLPYFTQATFSPDGQTLASAASSSTVGLWSVTEGVLQQSLGPECTWGQYDLLFAPDSRRLAGRCIAVPPYGDQSEQLALWDLPADGREPPGWSKQLAAINAYAPAGKLLATDSAGSALVDAASGSTIPLKLTGVAAAAFSPSGALLVVGDTAGTIHLLGAADGAETGVLEAGSGVSSLFFSPDGALLGARRADGLVQIWRMGESAPFANVGASAEDKLLISGDNQLLISSGPSGVAFYRLSDGKLLHRLNGAAEGVAIGPHRRALAIVRNGQIELWGIITAD